VKGWWIGIGVALVCAACSDDAGPQIQCDGEQAGQVDGELATPVMPVVFATLVPELAAADSVMPMLLRFADVEHELTFYFDYSPKLPVVGEYGKAASLVWGPDRDNLNQLTADHARLIVDASNWTEPAGKRCFAGRFEAPFDPYGTLTGWFRVH
jgi:hypothetical protein